MCRHGRARLEALQEIQLFVCYLEQDCLGIVGIRSENQSELSEAEFVADDTKLAQVMNGPDRLVLLACFVHTDRVAPIPAFASRRGPGG